MSELAHEGHERLQRAVELEERAPIFKRVAVMLAFVTCLAAGAGFLERSAATHQAHADRQARAKAIEAVSAGVAADTLRRERTILNSTAADVQTLANSYQGADSPYADAVGAAYGRAADQLQTWANGFFGRTYVASGRFDSVSFIEKTSFARYSTQEWQKAYARERSGWASKRGDFVLAITLFAVALFLLGITLTAPASSRNAFFLLGCGFALAAFALSIFTWTGSVAKPSPKAIDSFARAEAADDAGAPAAEIAADASTAIAYRGGYEPAYVLRGRVRLNEGERSAAGPNYAEVRNGRDDLLRATRLDGSDYFAWVNYSRALFVLRDYRGALAAANHAIRLEPGRPAVNLYRLLYSVVTGQEHSPSLESIARTLNPLPIDAWDNSLDTTESYADLALQRTGDKQSSLVTALHSLLGQLEIFQARLDSFGDFTERQSSARVTNVSSLVLTPDSGHDLGRLTVNFDYTDMPLGGVLLYNFFLNGIHWFTTGPFGGPLAVRDEPPLPASGSRSAYFAPTGGFGVGDRVRVDLFVDARPVAACSFTVTTGTIDPKQTCQTGAAAGQLTAARALSRPNATG